MSFTSVRPSPLWASCCVLLLLVPAAARVASAQEGGVWRAEAALGPGEARVFVHRADGAPDGRPWTVGDRGMLVFVGDAVDASEAMVFRFQYTLIATAGRIHFDHPVPYESTHVAEPRTGRGMEFPFTVAEGGLASDRGEITFNVTVEARVLDASAASPLVREVRVAIPVDETLAPAEGAHREAPEWLRAAGVAFPAGALLGLAAGRAWRRS